MDIDVIREALHREPFRPFTLRLADGRGIAIPHPDFVAVSRRRVVVINPADESTAIIEPLLIISVETATERTPSGNGPSAPS